MPIVNLCQQRKVVCGILVQHIVFNDDQLDLLHVESCIHLNCALVYQVNYCTLRTSQLIWVWARLRLCTLVRLILVFFKDGLIDLFCLLFAFVEGVVVSANDDNAKVNCKVSDIDVKNELFRYTWYTNGRPSLSSVFHARVSINVIHKHLNILWFQFWHLFRISEDTYRVHRTYEHPTRKSLWQIWLNTFLDDSPRLIWHS